MPFSFQVQHSDPNSSARTGLLTTWHGTIQTPAFMPVGTLGTVKGCCHLWFLTWAMA